MKHEREYYGMREGAETFPLMVVVSFAYVCNSKCPHCPYNNCDIRSTYRDAVFIGERIFRKIADECGASKSYIRVSSGGEPLMHPQAVELLVYAKRQGARIGLITNGSLATPQKLEVLIAAGVDNIEFSVDAGDEEAYNRVRCGLDWKTLNDHVRAAVEIRNRLKADTRFICSIVNQKGVDVEKAEKYWAPLVDKVQIRKYLTWGYNADNSADATPYLPSAQRIPCPWLFERMFIDSRGSVTFCGEDIAFANAFANVMDRSIRDIWHGQEFEGMREKHLRREGDSIPMCGKCPDWQYRSWNYNYWKIIDDAEKIKSERMAI